MIRLNKSSDAVSKPNQRPEKTGFFEALRDWPLIDQILLRQFNFGSVIDIRKCTGRPRDLPTSKGAATSGLTFDSRVLKRLPPPFGGSRASPPAIDFAYLYNRAIRSPIRGQCPRTPQVINNEDRAPGTSARAGTHTACRDSTFPHTERWHTHWTLHTYY